MRFNFNKIYDFTGVFVKEGNSGKFLTIVILIEFDRVDKLLRRETRDDKVKNIFEHEWD